MQKSEGNQTLDVLIAQTRRQARRLAFRFRLDPDDAVGEAMIGLVTALRDNSGGGALQSYAAFRVESRVIDYVRHARHTRAKRYIAPISLDEFDDPDSLPNIGRPGHEKIDRSILIDQLLAQESIRTQAVIRRDLAELPVCPRERETAIRNLRRRQRGVPRNSRRYQ